VWSQALQPTRPRQNQLGNKPDGGGNCGTSAPSQLWTVNGSHCQQHMPPLLK
jgi:hypothetical protein